MRIVVLGAGLVGSPMALDLSAQAGFDVTLLDRDKNALQKVAHFPITTVEMDVSDTTALKNILAKFDLVVSAVPGFLGYSTLKTIIEAGKNVVDIAFFPEDPFPLSQLALDREVTAIVDCGVAPGMSHILTGSAAAQLDSVETVRILVGGLPQVRSWPFEYKAVFSPLDVIEEYTRPARVVINGKVVEKRALSEVERISFDGVGTLEAFNSDGLRTLAKTIPARDMAEKTLRYPGHVQLMEVLRHSGFFSKESKLVNGQMVTPLDLTAVLLQKDWKLQSGEKDLTAMRITVEGLKGEKKLRHTYELLDFYDEKSRVHSMARVTGYTATVVAGLLAEGKIIPKGLVVPEYLGAFPETVDAILKGLDERGVHYSEKVEELSKISK